VLYQISSVASNIASHKPKAYLIPLQPQLSLSYPLLIPVPGKTVMIELG
jgi:hypothetical protein